MNLGPDAAFVMIVIGSVFLFLAVGIRHELKRKADMVRCEWCGSREIVSLQNVDGKRILLCHVCGDGLCSDHTPVTQPDGSWMWVKNDR